MKNNSLFSSLQLLYRKVSMVILNLRMHSYHSSVDSNDITSLLNKQIEGLVSSSAKDTTGHIDTSEIDEHVKHDLINKNNEKYKEVKNVGELGSEFSKYLNQRKTSSIIHPYMGDKLKKSAWEHIHHAIRYAHQGNAVSARLHADIAGHALEEASHYLKNEEYSELVYQVEECFIQSKKEKNKGGSAS